MLSWLQEKFSTEKLRNDLRMNDEYFPRDKKENFSQILPPSEAMVKALQISMITDKILTHLTLPDLQQCRLVDSNLHCIVSNFMVRRPDICRVEIIYGSEEKGFRRSHFSPETDKRNRKLSKHYSLAHLNKILSKSLIFPCTHFEFQFGNLAQLEPQLFFKIQSHHIKTLVLRDTYCYNKNTTLTPREVRTMLPPNNWRQKICPPSMAITLISRDDPHLIENEWVKGHSFAFMSFPLLQTLQWFCPVQPSPVWKILEKSINLKSIHTFNFPSELQALIDLKKIPLVTTLNLTDFKGTPQDLLELCRAGPRLKKISYFAQKSRNEEAWVNALNRLLQECSSTVENLGSGGLCALTGIKIPVLHKLTTLQLHPCRPSNRGNHFQRCFHPNLNLADKFPNLATLDIHTLPCYEDETWHLFFPKFQHLQKPSSSTKGGGTSWLKTSGVKLERVKTLKISDLCSEFWLQMLSGMCPNFKNLVLYSRESSFSRFNNNSNLHVILPKVFQLWSHLERLEIIVNRGGSTFGNVNLDPAMTGMSGESCHWLRQQFPSEEDQRGIRNLMMRKRKNGGGGGGGGDAKFRKQFDELRVAPSISDLKDLKELKIQLAEVWDCHCGELFCLSWVTGFFAFSQMPHTKFHLVFHTRKYDVETLRLAHADILPYVTIDCKPTSWWRSRDLGQDSL